MPNGNGHWNFVLFKACTTIQNTLILQTTLIWSLMNIKELSLFTKQVEN